MGHWPPSQQDPDTDTGVRGLLRRHGQQVRLWPRVTCHESRVTLCPQLRLHQREEGHADQLPPPGEREQVRQHRHIILCSLCHCPAVTPLWAGTGTTARRCWPGGWSPGRAPWPASPSASASWTSSSSSPPSSSGPTSDSPETRRDKLFTMSIGCQCLYHSYPLIWCVM